jgi:hypothetical protein
LERHAESQGRSGKRADDDSASGGENIRASRHRARGNKAKLGWVEKFHAADRSGIGVFLNDADCEPAVTSAAAALAPVTETRVLAEIALAKEKVRNELSICVAMVVFRK